MTATTARQPAEPERDHGRCAHHVPGIIGRCYADAEPDSDWCAQHQKPKSRLYVLPTPKTHDLGKQYTPKGAPSFVKLWEKPTVFCYECRRVTPTSVRAVAIDVAHQAFTEEHVCTVCSTARKGIRWVNRPEGVVVIDVPLDPTFWSFSVLLP